MPTIQRETAVLAGAVNDNLLSGSAYEYMRGNGVVSASVVATAPGSFITIQSGPDVILEEAPPFVLAGAGVFGVVPDHFYYNWAAAAGDRLLIRARNPTGGTITFKVITNIQYAN